MSHSTHASASSDAEPNLVPLLDLVLQLVMFFMMCANFVMEENDQSIKLPRSQQAKPVADTGPDVVTLGVTSAGHVTVVGRPQPLITDDELFVFLKHDVFDRALQYARDRKQGDEVKTLVIIRADLNADFAHVYRVMQNCQRAGLRRLQLRAERVLGG
jgi:biopolymer transport protein ExbD